MGFSKDEWYQMNKPRILTEMRKKYESDDEYRKVVLARNKAWRDKNSDVLNQKRRDDRKANPEKYREKSRRAYKKKCEAVPNFRENENERLKKYKTPENNRKNYLRSRPKYLERAKKQRENIPKDVYNAYHREYYARTPARRDYLKKRMNDLRKVPFHRLNFNMGTAIYLALRDKKSGRPWESLVGYTLQGLMACLESQFTGGMSWDNYGEWHVDHIVPKSWFNYELPEDPEFKKCWALENLQPLWRFDNISKSNRMLGG